LAPILISFSFKLVSDQFLIGSGVQRARHMRAVDQRRQGCDQVDTAVMQDVCGQLGATPGSCAGLTISAISCARWRRKGDDPLGRAREVGDDKADARIKLALMPLDFGNHQARLRPASGLIAEISIEPPDFFWWSSVRTLEQVADPALQDLVGRKPDRIFDPLGFQNCSKIDT
jgi:hypothetical protein